MRIAVVHPGPDFSVADVYNGLVRGLRQCGQEVFPINLNDRLEAYIRAEIREEHGRRRMLYKRADALKLAAYTMFIEFYTFWPDVIVFVCPAYIPPEMWAVLYKRPHHRVAWFTESPYEDDRQGGVAPHVDTVIINDPTNLDHMRTANKRTWYIPQSYDPDVHCPGPAVDEYRCDFGWVGTAFPSRIDFFQRVKWGDLDVKLGGHWGMLNSRSRLRKYLINRPVDCLNNLQTVNLYRSSKLSANIYRKEASQDGMEAGWSIGPREVELAATGTFFLREPRGEGDELFTDAPTFTEPGEFTELVHYWAGADEQRHKIAQLNREAVADRTFQHSAARLLELIDSAPKRV